jgi:hypothetical protein
MTTGADRLARLGRRQAGPTFRSVSVVPAVLGHGSGLDELAIFLFPVVLGIGFWLITRHKPDDDQDDENDDMTERG